jgi:hypothetical protein
MMQTRFAWSMGAAAVCVLTLATAAQAQTRTWVSGTGNDANPCSRTAPCKTFSGAHSKTAAGGEIDTLDPGGTARRSRTDHDRRHRHVRLGSRLTTGIIINAAGRRQSAACDQCAGTRRASSA